MPKTCFSFRVLRTCLPAVVAVPLTLACARQPDESHTKAVPEARKALGVGVEYQPKLLTADDGARLKKSPLERRRLAWELVAKTLAPAATASGHAVPTWATWYGKDDLQRMFHKLYVDLGKDGRKERRPFAPEALPAAEAWNARMVEDLPDWTGERYATWLSGIDADARAHSLSGMNRTIYSPAAARHVFSSYAAVNDCIDQVADVPFANLGLSAENFSLCYPSEFPAAAAVVKTAWVRDGLGVKVKTYDTDAATLATRLADAKGWEVPERESDPHEPSIYTLQLDGGSRFRLAGLHLMTKELREWVWITLWWSDKPDEDFGADRPAAVAALGAPWNQYKMCVVVGYDEEGAVDDEMRAQYPTLAAAMERTAAAVGPSSWCSNPYFEQGPANQRSNCIGCHQHAGSAFDPLDVLTDGERFPAEGRQRVRENFPSDYLWSFGKDPERWSSYIRNQISHYDIYDPLSGHSGG